MAKKRKNESKTDIDLYNFLTKNRKYYQSWETKKTQNGYVQTVLDTSSKAGTGYRGEPDLLYINENKRLLILIENKDSITDHVSKEKNKPKDFAVDGILHYISFFLNENLESFDSTIKNVSFP